jgi:hypothetical protein
MNTLKQTRCGLAALALAGTVTHALADPLLLFSDSFDTDTSANWSIYTSQADTAVVFAYDYSADGIPSAPNSSGGTTLGVKFTANMVAGQSPESAGLNIVPKGQNFTGDYVLKFDLWMNANGPFPAGGTGSTEFASAGIGLAGNGALLWHGAAPAGVGWFAVSGEGGASQDFRAYVGTTMQGEGPVYFANGSPERDNSHPYYAATFPGGQTPPASQTANHPQQTGALNVGTVGFAWRQVEISKVGDEVVWSIDGLPIAKLTGTGNGISLNGNITVGYFDPFNSVSDNPALSFGIVDNVRVEFIPEPSTLALGLLGFGAWLLARRRN